MQEHEHMSEEELQQVQEQFYDSLLERRRLHIERGLVRVNEETMDMDYVLKGNDVVVSERHCHEACVPDEAVQILYSDDSIVAAYKPAGIPVHPTGQFHFNSMTKILEFEHDLANLQPIYRIDKAASGVVFLGRSSLVSSALKKELRDGKESTRKLYLAEVKGLVTESSFTVDAPISVDKSGMRMPLVDRTSGKQSLSIFRVVGRSEERQTSMIACYPATGRTHQLRVHLTFVGHPILGDTVHSGASAIGQQSPVIPDRRFEEDFVDSCDQCQTMRVHHESPPLHLHALHYSFNTTRVTAPLPPWANAFAEATTLDPEQEAEELFAHKQRVTKQEQNADM